VSKSLLILNFMKFYRFLFFVFLASCKPDINQLNSEAERFEELGNLNAALEIRNEILSIDSINFHSLFNKGVIQQKQNNFAGAAQSFSKILEQKSLIVGLVDSSRRIEGSINLDEVRYQRANSYFKMKQWDRAADDYQQCISNEYKTEKCKDLLEFCIESK